MSELDRILRKLPAWDDDERAERASRLRRELEQRARRAATVPVKTCPRCTRKLPAKAFGEDAAQADGMTTRCRDCRAKAARTAA